MPQQKTYWHMKNNFSSIWPRCRRQLSSGTWWTGPWTICGGHRPGRPAGGQQRVRQTRYQTNKINKFWLMILWHTNNNSDNWQHSHILLKLNSVVTRSSIQSAAYRETFQETMGRTNKNIGYISVMRYLVADTLKDYLMKIHKALKTSPFRHVFSNWA